MRALGNLAALVAAVCMAGCARPRPLAVPEAALPAERREPAGEADVVAPVGELAAREDEAGAGGNAGQRFEDAAVKKRAPGAAGSSQLAGADTRRPSDPLPGLGATAEERAAVTFTYLERARRALARGDFDRAIAETLPALEIEPASVEAQILLARAYMEKGWLAKARRILETGTSAGKGAESARLWMMLGLVYERSGDATALARDAYTRATRLKPNYARAWTNLGAAQLELGDSDAAVAALETALSIDSESVVALTNLGTAYRRQAAGVAEDADRRMGLIRKAENAYRTALAVDEAYGPAHFDLGLLYLETDTFPGRSAPERLRLALRHLREYQRLTAEGPGQPAGPAVEEYLEAAQETLELFERTGG